MQALVGEAITVTSPDGTSIGGLRSGHGPPLVLVHGTGGTHARWLPLLPRLSDRFTVYAIDRRGRGRSGDRMPYEIEREFEDIAAVIDSIGEPVNLFGHSYGAICALEATLLTPAVRRLVVYEPPVPTGMRMRPYGLEERLRERMAVGDPDGVLVTFLREMERLPEEEIHAIRSSPAWEPRLAAVRTLPREIRLPESYRFQQDRFASLRVPTLILLGEHVPPFLHEAARVTALGVPTARIQVLPELRRAPLDAPPEQFLDALLQFFEESSGPEPAFLPEPAPLPGPVFTAP
jgi:pimeloyl-ACP methyl ester carboxylesterase